MSKNSEMIKKGVLNKQRAKQDYQQTKNSANLIIGEYTRYVLMCLNDEDHINAINSLLPFDKIVHIKLKNAYDESLVRSMGLTIMRIEFEPSVFSLGISLEVAEGIYNTPVNTIVLVSVCKTFMEMREYVQSDEFKKQVKETFLKLIENSFLGQCKNY